MLGIGSRQHGIYSMQTRDVNNKMKNKETDCQREGFRLFWANFPWSARIKGGGSRLTEVVLFYFKTVVRIATITVVVVVLVGEVPVCPGGRQGDVPVCPGSHPRAMPVSARANASDVNIFLILNCLLKGCELSG